MLTGAEPNSGWRRYAVRLAIIAALVLVIAGWLAAFSTIGAIFIFAGAGLFVVAGVLSWSPRGAALAVLAIVGSLYVLPVLLGLVFIVGNSLLGG